MRYYLFIVLFLQTLFSMAQVSGDVTGDDIIDANDFLLLKSSILEGKPIKYSADFDRDGEYTVRDLILLHNFLYKNGTSLDEIEIQQNDNKVSIQFGQFDAKQNTLEIIISSKGVKCFQFEIPGLANIQLKKEIPNIYVTNNRIMGAVFKDDFFDEKLVLKLNLPKGINDEYCITNTLFADELGNDFNVKVGDCANPSWTYAGLNKVMQDVLSDQFDIASDIDLNGSVDIKDYTVLYDYLYLKGETPPGQYVEVNERVKLTVTNNNVEDDYLELTISGEGKINSFDISLYGIDTILSATVNIEKANELKIVGNRIIYFGNKKSAQKEIVLRLKHQKFTAKAKVCIKNPVVLDQKNHYFQVKLGRCLDVYPIIYGCTDRKAINYNSNAIVDDGSCEYPIVVEKIKPVKEVVKKERDNKLKPENKSVKEKEKERLVKNKEKKNQTKAITSDKLAEKQEAQKAKEAAKKEKRELQMAKQQEKLATKTKEEEERKVSINEYRSTVKVLSLRQSQINQLTDISKGQMIYNEDTKVFMVYDGKKWKSLKVNPDTTIK